MPSQVVVNFIGNAGKLIGAVKQVEDSTGRLQNRITPLGKGLAAGLGFGFATSAAGLFSTAVSEVTDVIGDSIKAALADEESQNRLAASLRTNVPAWDGTTDAIEKNILAKQRLGFADEDLRDALTVLVGATHDVTKAQDIMNTAMDLARFKGIDLKTASESLIKVEAGVYRSLKGLGIQLRDGATQTEALAAVQKVAAGQAEAFAQTNSGRLLASQIKVDEAMERFGNTIMPGVIDIVTMAADGVIEYADALDNLQHITSLTSQEQKDFGVSLLDLTSRFLPPLWLSLRGIEFAEDKLGLATKTVSQTVIDQSQAFADEVTRNFDHTGEEGIQPLIEKVIDFRVKFADTAGAVIRSSDKIRSQLAKDAQGLIDGYFDPIELAADLFDTRMRLSADRTTYQNAKTKEDHRRAKDAIVQDLDDQATKLRELGDKHALTGAQVDAYERDVTDSYKAIGEKVPPQLQKVISTLRTLASFDGKKVRVDVYTTWRNKFTGTGTGTHPGGGGPQEFATGGMVAGPVGSPQMVLAHAGEVVGWPVKGSSGGITINVTGPVYGDGIDELMYKLAARIQQVGGLS